MNICTMHTNTDIHMLMYKKYYKCKCVIAMLRALRQSVHTDVVESQTQWAATGSQDSKQRPACAEEPAPESRKVYSTRLV